MEIIERHCDAHKFFNRGDSCFEIEYFVISSLMFHFQIGENGKPSSFYFFPIFLAFSLVGFLVGLLLRFFVRHVPLNSIFFSTLKMKPYLRASK